MCYIALYTHCPARVHHDIEFLLTITFFVRVHVSLHIIIYCYMIGSIMSHVSDAMLVRNVYDSSEEDWNIYVIKQLNKLLTVSVVLSITPQLVP